MSFINNKTLPDISSFKDKPAGVMLLDCFERVVGTPEEQGYFELVAYTESDTHALLEKSTDGGTENERKTSYLIPVEAVQNAFDIISRYGMSDWNDRDDTVGICGMLFVCKFPLSDGSYVRVSSESMPDDGTAAFREVSGALCAYCIEEYLK